MHFFFIQHHEKITIFFIVLVGLSAALFLANFIVTKALEVPSLESFKNIITNNAQKTSAYECGFDPFDDARSIFFVHFYVVALLFLVFDIEVIYMVP
jgi:NADH-quinone oxidoreductase subunit A